MPGKRKRQSTDRFAPQEAEASRTATVLNAPKGNGMVGARIFKIFADKNGYRKRYTGCVTKYNEGLYSIKYSDGDREQLTYNEMKLYHRDALKGARKGGQVDKAAAAATPAKKQKTAKKKPAAKKKAAKKKKQKRTPSAAAEVKRLKAALAKAEKKLKAKSAKKKKAPAKKRKKK